MDYIHCNDKSLVYANFPDGSIDYNCPYHIMLNPNTCIPNVLTIYSNKTRELLGVLKTVLENSVSQSDPNNQWKVDNEMFPNVDYCPPGLQHWRAYIGNPTIKPLPKYPYMDHTSTTSSSSYSSSNHGKMPDPYNMAKQK
eukprot:4496928-Ditylum_brightwellii.AAC.1